MKNICPHSSRSHTMKRRESTSPDAGTRKLDTLARPCDDDLVGHVPVNRHEGLGAGYSESLLPPGVGCSSLPRLDQTSEFSAQGSPEGRGLPAGERNGVTTAGGALKALAISHLHSADSLTAAVGARVPVMMVVEGPLKTGGDTGVRASEEEVFSVMQSCA
jgi:hypothetical protein